jgi:hypothetical protein
MSFAGAVQVRKIIREFEPCPLCTCSNPLPLIADIVIFGYFLVCEPMRATPQSAGLGIW